MQTYLIADKGTEKWQGIPAIERAANGRLWSAFYSGGPKEPDIANAISLATSDDNGTTWSRPAVVIDPVCRTRAYDPALWHDPAGRLWLFYNTANLDDHAFRLWACTTGDSHERFPAWSAARHIEIDAPFAFRMNKPTVLSNGDWLLPVTWAKAAPEDWFWFKTGEHLQGVAISSDAGKTWTLYGGVEAPAWALENMIVERRDGTLWMLIRTSTGVIWQSFSDDGGRSWSASSPTRIANPGTRFYIGRLASGRLLLINTPDPKERTTLYAYLSETDDDTGFQRSLALDLREKVSYPDAVQAPDGTIYAVHDCDRYGSGEIVLNVFTECEM